MSKLKYITCSTLSCGVVASPLVAVAQDNSSDEVRQRYNVVYVMCDDFNDYSGAFGGHPQIITPNIDRIAKAGAQFVTACSNVPVSQPSRNSLFTGVYPHESKDFGWTERRKQPVLKNNKNLMELFQENGYQVLGTGKLLHNKEPECWDKSGMPSANNYGPFVSVDKKMAVHKDVPQPYASIGPIDGSFGPMTADQQWVNGWASGIIRYESDEDRDLVSDELHAQWAVEQLQNMDSSSPFFLGVGFVRPHTPLHAPQKYFDMYPLETIELSQWFAEDDLDTYFIDHRIADSKGYSHYELLLESYGGDHEIAIKHFLQAYMACITFVDEQIGKVWDALEQSPYRDNTIFVFTSDHGWQMGEKKFIFKNSPWEESARIPMIINHPEADSGMVVEQPVSLIDIYPTLVDMCGLEGDNRLNEQGAELSGYSMLPLLMEQQWDGPAGALTMVGNLGAKTTIYDQHFSYRTKEWRYIRYKDGAEELYNHINDSFEWNNLAQIAEFAEVKAQLKAEMCEILGVKLK